MSTKHNSLSCCGYPLDSSIQSLEQRLFEFKYNLLIVFVSKVTHSFMYGCMIYIKGNICWIKVVIHIITLTKKKIDLLYGKEVVKQSQINTFYINKRTIFDVVDVTFGIIVSVTNIIKLVTVCHKLQFCFHFQQERKNCTHCKLQCIILNYMSYL